MTTDEFLVEFQDMLQRDDAVDIDMVLKDIEEWDSMSVMACMAWFDMKLGIKNPYKTYAAQKTVRDLIKLADGKIA